MGRPVADRVYQFVFDTATGKPVIRSWQLEHGGDLDRDCQNPDSYGGPIAAKR